MVKQKNLRKAAKQKPAYQGVRTVFVRESGREWEIVDGVDDEIATFPELEDAKRFVDMRCASDGYQFDDPAERGYKLDRSAVDDSGYYECALFREGKLIGRFCYAKDAVLFANYR